MTALGRSGTTYAVMSSLTSPQHNPIGVCVQPKNPKLYKTELCRSWMDMGRCNYGDRCQYAHGEHEKRPIPRHPKYKTTFCQSYHKSGYCPYGPRCHFIHNEDPVLVSKGSTGDSPVPSSAGSGSDSPVGSASPPLDNDDTFNKLNTSFGTYFNWPPAAMNGGDGLNGTTPATTPSSWNSASNNQDSIGLLNDFLGWHLDDVTSTNTTTVSPVIQPPPRTRLPVFAQFSNASST